MPSEGGAAGGLFVFRRPGQLRIIRDPRWAGGPQGDLAMKGPLLVAVGLLTLTVLGGCKGTAGPCWCHPGPAPTQQTRALRYDPYPENEAGPAMVGVRPREYQKPPPEASRARWEIGKWGQ
jgi:hypothetical protein